MPESNEHSSYLLGVSQQELERLQFQHGVWGPVAEKFLGRLNVASGWRCLDVGAGLGFVTMHLRECVSETGEVTALDPSQSYLDWLRKQTDDNGWKNVICVQGTAENTALPSRYDDLIMVRWVIAFVPEPEKFLLLLSNALRIGRIIAIQDYYYEGLSLFPRGGMWDTMPDIVRTYYCPGGGDAHVTGKIPSIFRKNGMELLDFTPTCLSRGPISGVMGWAHRFFSLHIPHMVEKGMISPEQADALMVDWNTHRQNPDTVFFSPLVVDVAGIAHR